jgi:capsular polysaccharide biosynthesis protein
MADPSIRLPSLLRRWWLPVLVAMVAGALVSWTVGSRISPTYEASAQVLVEGAPGLTPTYAELVKSTPVLRSALRSTKSDLSVADVRADVRGEADQNTRLVTIQVDAGSGRAAIQLANALAAGLKAYVAESRAASGTATALPASIELVDPAGPAARVRPLTSLLLLFGAAVGFLGGVAFALMVESRNPKVSAGDELGETIGLPVLGAVNGKPLGAGTLSFNPVSALDESAPYRRLATQIAVANKSDTPRSLVVVGADGAEGSRTVAVRLAYAFALEGRRVVLADFEGGGIKRSLRIEQRGQKQAMRRVEPLVHAGLVVDRFALRSGRPLVLACARSEPDGLGFETAQELVGLMSAEADVLIVHAPPPSSSRAALTWARATEATVLVVRGQQTKQAQVAETLAALESARTKLVGAVLQR